MDQRTGVGSVRVFLGKSAGLKMSLGVRGLDSGLLAFQT